MSRNPHHMQARWLALLGALCLTLLGCAGASADDAVGSGRVDAVEAAADVEVSPASAPSTSGTESAPVEAAAADSGDDGHNGGDSDPGADASATSLAELFGLPLDAVSDKDVDQFYIDLEVETERRTALCMIANGFDYVPVDLSSLSTFSSELDRNSLDYVEQFGFGIATDPLGEVTDAYVSFENPNDTHVATLSSSERDAYYMTLSGMTAEDMADSNGYITSGCRGDADAEVYQVFGVVNQFLDDIKAIDAKLANRSEVISARSVWSACMANEGIVAESPVDLRVQIRKDYSAITEQNDSYVDGTAPVANYGADPVLNATSSEPMTSEAIAAIDALAAEEVRAAVLDHSCGTELRRIEAEIRGELELGFVTANGSDVRSALAG